MSREAFKRIVLFISITIFWELCNHTFIVFSADKMVFLTLALSCVNFMAFLYFAPLLFWPTVFAGKKGTELTWRGSGPKPRCHFTPWLGCKIFRSFHQGEVMKTKASTSCRFFSADKMVPLTLALFCVSFIFFL